MKSTQLLVIGIVVAVVGAAIALYGMTLWDVHRVAWGLLVALYEYFGVVAAGSAIIASLIVLARLAGYLDESAERVARLGLVLALAGLIAAGFTVGLKSGFPSTLTVAYFSIKLDSAIGRMLLLLPAFIVVTLVAILVSTTRNLREVKALVASLVIIIAVLAYANAGSVFQSMASVPLWHVTPMTALFIAGAVAWGASAQSLYVLASERRLALTLARAFGLAIALGVLAYATILYFTKAGYTWIAAEAWSRIVESALFTLSFYILGLIIPLVLGIYVFVSGDTRALPIAAISAIVGGFIVHSMLIIVPQTLALTGFREVVEIPYHIAADEALGAVGATILLLGLLIAGVGALNILEARQVKQASA
ncbi:MAG: NrfD/PsrC family molybdoenzyme membrane anchor subunit [Acidilobaceae archaeon]